METILIIAAVWFTLNLVAWVFIFLVILIYREEDTLSPMALLMIYRKQFCAILKRKK